MPEHLDRARTPLLTLITLESLDEDYVVAGRRRAARASVAGDDGAARARRRTSRTGAVAVLVVFGLLVAVAAVQNSREAGVKDESRETLISRINQQRGELTRSEQELADLREQDAAADRALTTLVNQLSAAQAKVADSGALTGLTSVVGPAIRVVLDSSPYADEDSRVRDSDLALLVDALWGAGAEAVTINGQRVTGRTGIRTSGDAIEVNGIGVAPPYTVLAIGDTDAMSANFLNSQSGQDFVGLADQYDFRYDVHDVGEVRMAPAPAGLTKLRSVRATGAARGGSGGTSDKSGTSDNDQTTKRGRSR